MLGAGETKQPRASSLSPEISEMRTYTRFSSSDSVNECIERRGVTLSLEVHRGLPGEGGA